MSNPEEATKEAKRRGPKTVTPKQRAANRANATRSTGPKTPAGRHRSRENSTTHGAYATTLYPVPSGMFREDLRVVDAFVQGIITGLAPRDVVEDLQAERVALEYLRQHRIDRLEAEVLAADGTVNTTPYPSDHPQPVAGDPTTAILGASPDAVQPAGEKQNKARWVGGPDDIVRLWESARAALDAIREPDVIAPDWEQGARFLAQERRDGRTNIPNVWDDEHTPSTHDQWQLVFTRLKDDSWDSDEAATRWIEDFMDNELVRRAQRAGRAIGTAARRALNSMSQSSTLRARATRDLLTHLALYAQLQTRELPDQLPRETNP